MRPLLSDGWEVKRLFTAVPTKFLFPNNIIITRDFGHELDDDDIRTIIKIILSANWDYYWSP